MTKLQKQLKKRKSPAKLAKEAREDLDERQGLRPDSETLLRQRKEHTSESPTVSGGDVDAAWDKVNMAGEETLGGTAPTPDQDTVDELGKAAGLVYNDDEPLNYEEKMQRRDVKRWEFN